MLITFTFSNVVIYILLISLFNCCKCYQTTKPQRFVVDKRNFFDIVPATMPFLLRIGNGALVSNYQVSIEKETELNSKQYTFLSLFGFRVTEKSSVAFKNRPNKLLEVYEFEGCPFCRKVREAVSVLDLG